MEPELAEQIYELDRCIECGCCVAACGTAQHARGLSPARWASTRSPASAWTPGTSAADAEFYELVGDESGVFGCMTLLGCEDMCPKDLPTGRPDRLPAPAHGLHRSNTMLPIR